MTTTAILRYALIALIILLPGAFLECAGQGTSTNFRQFAFNPYVFNPAYAAMHGKSEVNVALRKQWLDFRDAPMTSGINFQLPVSGRVILGGSFVSQSQVIVNSSFMNASFTYIVPLTSKQQVRLGIAGGLGINRLHLTAEEMNSPDPVISNAAGTTLSPDGSFGAVYTFGKFHAGFALTNIFNNTPFSPSKFEGFKFSNFRNRTYSMGYRFALRSDKQFEIEPYALYHQSADPIQNTWEVSSILHLRNVLSVGASYNQKRGAGFFLGFNFAQSIRVGYSYELATGTPSRANTNAHELQLGLRFGNRKTTVVRPPKTGKTQTPPTRSVQTAVPSQPGVEPSPVAASKRIDDEKAEEKPLRYFVIAGVFTDADNAKDFAKTLVRQGHFADILVEPNGKNYVFVFVSGDVLEARKIRGIYRERMPELKAWIFTHE